MGKKRKIPTANFAVKTKGSGGGATAAVKNLRRSSRRSSSGVQKRTAAKSKIADYDRCKDWIASQKKEHHEVKVFSETDDSDEDNEEVVRSSDQEYINETAGNISEAPSGDKPENVKYLTNYECDWKRCRTEVENYDDFKIHIDGHIENIVEQDSYVCHWDLCNFKVDNLKALRIHLYYHVYHTNLKVCGENQLDGKKLPNCVIDSRRRNLIPENLTESKCDWRDCNFKSEKIYKFFDHMREHCLFEASLRRSRKDCFQCGWNECEKTFKLKQRFMEHLRIHSNQKLFACPSCGSSFKAYNRFHDHYKRQAVNNDYQCVQCLKCFYNEELLASHMYFHVNCYKCTLCNMTCPSPSALAKHVRYVHVTERPIKCTHCDQRFVVKADVDRHIQIMHEKIVYECEEFGCTFTAKTLYVLKKHDQNVHENAISIYACHCCPNKYKQGCLLSQHLIKKHGFQLPSGHPRFTYRQALDGFHRLQTMRMESLEVTQQIMSPSHNAENDLHGCSFAVSNIAKTDKGFSLNVSIAPKDVVPHAEEGESLSTIAIHNLKEEKSLDIPFDDDANSENTEKLGRSSMIKKDDDVVVSTTSVLKNITDFSVMKRYLKKEQHKNIIIEVNDVDGAGNVLKTGVMRADEFRIGGGTL